MAKHVTRTASAITAAGLLLTSVAVAVASLPRDGGAPAPVSSHSDPIRNLAAAPIGGAHLFAGGEACIGTEDAIRQLDAERRQIGGETVMLDKGLDQAFADTWRLHTDQESIQVTAVLAHVVGEDARGIVDVIEFDGNGCAMTRTVLGVNDWSYLLRKSIDTGV